MFHASEFSQCSRFYVEEQQKKEKRNISLPYNGSMEKLKGFDWKTLAAFTV